MLAAILLPTLLAPGTEPPADAVKLNEPRVQYRMNEASATTSPWVDSNGSKILRSPGRNFVYQVKGEAAALAAAESFTYGAAALVSADAPGSEAFRKMLDFIKSIPPVELSPVADFGVIDDGSGTTGELLNLLTRMNLLYRIEQKPNPAFRVNVKIGSPNYPVEEAKNPSIAAHKVRSELGDDHRSLRLYGSEVVIGHLIDGPRSARLYLLNYANRPVLGLRVRVSGVYGNSKLYATGLPGASVADLTQDGPATEFSLPELRTFAVIDLSR